jgi:uncharacterized membrane protein
MVLVSYNELKELAGPISGFTFVVGLVGGVLSYCTYRRLRSLPTQPDALRFVSILPLLMGILAFFLSLFAALSKAYSGPSARHPFHELAGLDKFLAAYIAFAFAIVFAFDCLRIEALRKRAATWIVIIVYSLMAGFGCRSY